MPTGIRRRLSLVRRKWNRAQISRLLGRTGVPATGRAESEFDLLQSTYQGVPEYGYDRVTTWKRGCERAQQLVTLVADMPPALRTLEVGCGDGMTGYLLETFGHSVALTDMEDWRDARAAKLEFTAVILEKGLSYPDASFDFAYSYNTFEHLADPAICLKEMLRVLKPGGRIFLEFGPLYASPWGLHAYRTLKMPYPQWLFSEEFVLRKLAELGMSDLGKERTELQPLNRWRPADFSRLWESSGCEILMRDEWRNEEFFALLSRYPESFLGRGLTVDDIAIAGLRVLLKKR